MLRTLLHYFSLAFPYTFARLTQLYLLLIYGFIDLQSLVVAIIPTCIHHIQGLANYRFNRDGEEEQDPPNRRGPFTDINRELKFWFFVYKAFDVLSALKLVLSTSGFWRKVFVAIDLFIAGTLDLMAKTVFLFGVGFFVNTALYGFPFVKSSIIESWMALKPVILVFYYLWQVLWEDFIDKFQNLWQELWRRILERGEGPAEGQLLEEDDFEEDDVF